MLHSLSRALHEEVQFDTEKVTSVDWISSPSLTHADTPATIDIVLVNGDPNPNRPDLPHYGAGETVCKPLIAAVANAIFDATGVRLRRVPFRDGRVLAALKAAAPALSVFRAPPVPCCSCSRTRRLPHRPTSHGARGRCAPLSQRTRASVTIFPPTMVRIDRMCLMSSSGTVKKSLSSTAMSAWVPRAPGRSGAWYEEPVHLGLIGSLALQPRQVCLKQARGFVRHFKRDFVPARQEYRPCSRRCGQHILVDIFAIEQRIRLAGDD
jgi:hypothetical protein